MKRNLTILLVSILFFGCKKDITVNPDLSLPILTTKSVISIFQTTITCGGDISSDGGTPITARGLCWSTSPNPVITDQHTIDGSGTGSFTSSITNLLYDSIYFIRAYATNSEGTAYGNEISTHVPPLPVEIFVVGMKDDLATIWKNGIVTTLFNFPSYAYSIYMSGDDVYVTGRVADNGVLRDRVVIWKNGIQTFLTDGQHQAIGFSIFVKNNDVYVAGFENNINDISIAKIWKNGVETVLTDGTHEANAQAIYVDGTDYYVVGYEEVSGPTDLEIKVWKNGIPTTIGHTMDPGVIFYGRRCGITKSGNDVYVTATVKDATSTRATVWKNGVPVILAPLSNGSGANSILVSGSDVFTAGNNVNSSFWEVATYWKNGTATTLPSANSGRSTAEDIFVLGSDVYVTGFETTAFRERLVVWKNGVPIAWPDEAANYSFGGSIFVRNP